MNSESKQKNIAIINPEDFGYDLAVLARKMGYTVTGVMIELPDRYNVLKDIYCFDTDGLARAYDKLITVEHWEDAVWQLRPLSPCAVISGSEIAVDYTDHIAAALGLPCNDPGTIPLRRNKIEMKRAVRAAGLAHAHGDVFSTFASAASFVRAQCGYPVVVKPVCGAGSKNVFFCNTEEEFAAAFESVQNTPDAYLRRSNNVLVEEYIAGDEYVVNMMGTADGVFVTDIWKYEKIRTEYSDCVYYNDIMQDPNEPRFDELRSYAQQLYRAVGIRIGPAHAEIKMSPHGPAVIEIGSRLAGGEMPKYAALTTNCNSLEKTIEVFITGTAAMPEKIECHAFAASADISHRKFGRLVKFNGLEKVRKLPSYAAEVLYAHAPHDSTPGDYLEPTRDVDHLAALFWFVSADRKQIRADLEKSHRLCSITVDNSRIIVVGTTTDYVDMLRKKFPNELLFITDRTLREHATERRPAESEELLCDVSDFKTVLSLVRAHTATYHQHITGITCFDCESLLLTAYLAGRLHCAFPSSRAVANCRAKDRAAALWKNAGIACPETKSIASFEQALDFFTKSGGPCVIKPATGSGSEFTFLCATKQELENAWDTVMADVASKSSEPMYSAPCGGSQSIIIQKWCKGTEYSCDFIVKGCTATILRLCRKYPREGKFGATESYELLPPAQWPQCFSALPRTLARAARVLGGLEHAVIMCDIIEDSGTLTLLEMTPRTGGDCIPPLVEQACGISTLSLAVNLAAGQLKKPETLPVTEPYAAFRLFPGQSGIICAQDTSRLAELPEVTKISLCHKPGFFINSKISDYGLSLLGYVICKTNGRTTEEERVRIAANFHPTITSLGDKTAELISLCETRRDAYIAAWKSTGNKACRVFSRESVAVHARAFKNAFSAQLPDCGFYYAMKCNSYPEVITTAAAEGFGADVSSGDELKTARALGVSQLEFSGPGKTDDELHLALDYADSVTVLLDSFGELERLSSLAEQRHISIRAGVRIQPPGGWEKFGIPLPELKHFFRAASSSPFVSLEGIQFHTSWNMNAGPQIAALRALSLELKTETTEQLSRISFIDVGGGYWPEEGEWLLGSEDERLSLGGRIFNPSVPITQFAADIAAAVRTYIFPLTACQIRFEPGRWIANSSMDILVSVADKKDASCVVADAGTNCIGWDRFQSDYFPVINLSHPGTEEHPCRIYGSLCDPHDIWGFSYFGTAIERGDILLIPNQGAYTYSLQQQFIKPLPPVISLKE